MSGLNAKQEKFCQEVIKGTYLKDAYINAGYEKNGSASANADRLSKKPEVKARLKELTDEKKAVYDSTFDSLVQEVLKIVYSPTTKDTTKIQAVKELCNMLGYHKSTDQKVELNVNKEINDMNANEIFAELCRLKDYEFED